MPSTLQGIRVVRGVGWIIQFVTLILALSFLVDVVSLYPLLARAGDWYPAVQRLLPYVVGIIVTQTFAGWLFSRASEQQRSLEEKAVGYLIANRAVGLDILARVLNLTQREAADLVARLVSKGVLKGYTIDLQGQTIYREAPPAQASPPPSTPGGASPYVGVVKPDVSLDEPVKIKAQLWELEVLKQKGQISEQAYAKLKDELEKKLAAAETGTRVYA